jgi:hypothetical protein
MLLKILAFALYASPPSVQALESLSHPNYYCSLYGPGTDRTENIAFIIVCSLIAGEAMCPQSFSLAMAVVLSPVYTAVTWQWVYMSHCSLF